MQLTGFPAIASADAKILILGSMPGKRSLEQQQYYAHPQNRFWPIMAALFGFSVDLDYAQRIGQLTKHRVALWDVLQNCQRTTSLDSDIRPGTLVANDFQTFFKHHTSIVAVFFNGQKSRDIYNRLVKKHLDSHLNPACIALPSTSPAHAAMTAKEKLRHWSILLDYLET